MMPAVAQPVAHRSRVLRALGMTPWVRRSVAAATPEGTSALVDTFTAGACVVVIPDRCSVRELDLLGRALTAGGASLARAARLTVSAGQVNGEVPRAPAYLVFGEAQAHALGRGLSTEAMLQAQIVLADEPARIVTDAGAKRRLWNALRSVRRALVVAGA